jgi:hypothetical protein
MEEWKFGLQRLIHFPAGREQSERNHLLKALASCPRHEEKAERYISRFITLKCGQINETKHFSLVVFWKKNKVNTRIFSVSPYVC